MEGDCRSSSSELSDSSESVKGATTTANGTPSKKVAPKSRSTSNSPNHAHKE